MESLGVLTVDPADDRSELLLSAIAGRTLLGHAIRTLQSCPSVSRILVYSRDQQVVSTAVGEGVSAATVPQEEEGARHKAGSLAFRLLGALSYAESILGETPRVLLAFSPLHLLTTADDLERCISLLSDGNRQLIFSATETHGPIWLTKDGKFSRMKKGADGSFWTENGVCMAMTAKKLRSGAPLLSGSIAPCGMSCDRLWRADHPISRRLIEGELLQQSRTEAVAALPRQIGAIVFDFDGVFTDNKVVVFQDGREAAICDRSDGWGLAQLRRKSAIPILVLSTERSPIVRSRCEKLSLQCIHDVPDKLPVLLNWLREQRIDPLSVIYVGNDLNDLDCMGAVGCPIAVADAHAPVKAVARIVLASSGGRGAVREVADLIMSALI